MAAKIMTSLLLHTDKDAIYLERIQAKHYAMGAEQYVAHLLEVDFQKDKNNKRHVDHEKEDWNIHTLDYPFDQGSVDISVIDEQRFFNINWLIAEDEEGKKNIKMFQNLLSSQSIDINLANKIHVWLGASVEAPGAIADDAYLTMDHPRRAGRTEMVSVTELKLVQGITPEQYSQLAPLLTALPKASTINLNTALLEVICALSDKITKNDALSIIEARGEDGFSTLEDLSTRTDLNEKISLIKNKKVSFCSEYFTVYIKAIYRQTPFYLKTRLIRNNSGRVQIAWREFGPNNDWLIINKES